MTGEQTKNWKIETAALCYKPQKVSIGQNPQQKDDKMLAITISQCISCYYPIYIPYLEVDVNTVTATGFTMASHQVPSSRHGVCGQRGQAFLQWLIKLGLGFPKMLGDERNSKKHGPWILR